ncbi:hypothetical protein CRUP_028435 [Coryphaenoides rupestris]|nr:hypothetical protein CRUP_028435 [Coryphaenoides rupestris]
MKGRKITGPQRSARYELFDTDRLLCGERLVSESLRHVSRHLLGHRTHLGLTTSTTSTYTTHAVQGELHHVAGVDQLQVESHIGRAAFSEHKALLAAELPGSGGQKSGLFRTAPDGRPVRDTVAVSAEDMAAGTHSRLSMLMPLLSPK